jgi:hypothetical protein
VNADEFETGQRAGEYFHTLTVLAGAWTVLRLDGRGCSRFTQQRFAATGTQEQIGYVPADAGRGREILGSNHPVKHLSEERLGPGRIDARQHPGEKTTQPNVAGGPDDAVQMRQHSLRGGRGLVPLQSPLKQRASDVPLQQTQQVRGGGLSRICQVNHAASRRHSTDD